MKEARMFKLVAYENWADKDLRVQNFMSVNASISVTRDSVGYSVAKSHPPPPPKKKHKKKKLRALKIY